MKTKTKMKMINGKSSKNVGMITRTISIGSNSGIALESTVMKLLRISSLNSCRKHKILGMSRCGYG